MKQKFTIENFGEFINLKSNFKNVSLMKKQLFSLMMAFALVVGLSVSAFAQNTGWAVASPIWHLPGSTHGFAVADHTNSDYVWAISSVDCDGNAGTGAAQTITAVSGSEHQASVTYTDNASGLYRITVTESTTGDEECSTTREFFTAIMDINVVVIASDDSGTEITAGALTTCNDYVSIMGSDLVGNEDADDGGNDLAANIDASLFNARYVNVTLDVADNTGCTVAGQPTASDFAWQFDYTIADGLSTGTNFVDNLVSVTSAATTVAIAEVGPIGTITVDAGTTTFTLEIRSNIRWGTDGSNADQSFTFTVDSGSTNLDDDTTLDYTDGTEPASANGDNASALQHIDASPATPRIIIND
jgi:hypothetical protein